MSDQRHSISRPRRKQRPYNRGSIAVKTVLCIKALRRERLDLKQIEEVLGVKSFNQKTARRYINALEEAYVPVMYTDADVINGRKRVYWIDEGVL